MDNLTGRSAVFLPSCPDLFHCCPVWMGWTRRKALVQADFRPFRRIGTRVAACPHLPSRCHPGLEPGSSATGTAVARLPPDRGPGRACPGSQSGAWTPAQGRGDNGARRQPRPSARRRLPRRHARTRSGHPRLAASRSERGQASRPTHVDARNKSGHDGIEDKRGGVPVPERGQPTARQDIYISPNTNLEPDGLSGVQRGDLVSRSTRNSNRHGLDNS